MNESIEILVLNFPIPASRAYSDELA